MTCFYCKGDLKPSTTTHFVDLKKWNVQNAVKPFLPMKWQKDLMTL